MSCLKCDMLDNEVVSLVLGNWSQACFSIPLFFALRIIATVCLTLPSAFPKL